MARMTGKLLGRMGAFTSRGWGIRSGRYVAPAVIVGASYFGARYFGLRYFGVRYF